MAEVQLHRSGMKGGNNRCRSRLLSLHIVHAAMTTVQTLYCSFGQRSPDRKEMSGVSGLRIRVVKRRPDGGEKNNGGEKWSLF